MILNLLRVETLRVEEMIKRSFSENASQRLLPDQQKQAVEVSISDVSEEQGLDQFVERGKALLSSETQVRHLPA